MSDFGKQLKVLREERGISQEQLAGKMRVAPHSIYRYETGERVPNATKIEELARALDVEPGEFFPKAMTGVNRPVATRLRVLRAERGLTLREVEEKTGVAKETISGIERGARRPQDRTLARIASGYGVLVEELLEKPVLTAGPLPATTLGDSMQLERLKEWRESRGLTQKEFAGKAGVGEVTVARVETGASIRPNTARKLADALGLSVVDLLGNPPDLTETKPGVQEKYPRWCSFCATVMEGADFVMEVSLLGEGVKAISEPATICTQCVYLCMEIIEERRASTRVKRFVRALDETRQVKEGRVG